MTFKILTDSTADLPESWTQENDVQVLGLTVQLDGITYETVGPDRLTSKVLLEKIAAGSKPTTSQVNVGQFESYFRQSAENGQEVLYIAFSSVLSGTYQSAVMARDIVLEEYPQASIEIVDTLAAAGGEGYLAMLAAQAREEGKSLKETKELILDVGPRLRTFFLVDNLYHLMRGGRLSKTSAVVGSLVNIKPLLWLDASGKLVPLAKLRGCKKGMKEMLKRATADVAHDTAVVAYANDSEAAENLKEQLLANEKIKNGITGITEKDDYYILHEYFEENNRPMYLYNFNKMLLEHQLIHVVDSDLMKTFPNISNEIEEKLTAECGNDNVAKEQYYDFLLDRQFRISIVTHEANKEKINISKDVRITDLKEIDIRGKYEKNKDGFYIIENNEIKGEEVSLILDILSENYPNTITIDELEKKVKEKNKLEEGKKTS